MNTINSWVGNDRAGREAAYWTGSGFMNDIYTATYRRAGENSMFEPKKCRGTFFFNAWSDSRGFIYSDHRYFSIFCFSFEVKGCFISLWQDMPNCGGKNRAIKSWKSLPKVTGLATCKTTGKIDKYVSSALCMLCLKLLRGYSCWI